MLALAFVAVIAIAVLLVFKPDAANEAVSGFLIGIGGMFARNIGSAFDFEFGSSRGSKEKSAALAAIAPSASASAATSVVANAALERFKREMARD